MGIKLIGFGKYLPDTVVSNEDLEKIVDTSDEWIFKRTGIKKRHFSRGEYTFSMGLKAAKNALECAKIDAKDLDLIIFSTTTPDFYFPSMSNVIQGKLGATKAFGIDIACACAGFVYALDMAQRYINFGDGISKVLIISSENTTKTVDYCDRSTCVLFGDGAGAVVVEKGPNKAYSYLGTSGENAELIYAHLYPPGNFVTTEKDLQENSKIFPNKTGRYMFMWGQKVYRFAVEIVVSSLKKACYKAKIEPKDLDIVVFHQANARIIEAAADELKIGKEKLYINIEETGNISSASIPVCLTELFLEGKLQKGKQIGIVGFGAGMIYGAMVFTV